MISPLLIDRLPLFCNPIRGGGGGGRLFYCLYTHSKGLENVREAKIKVESALSDVTKLTTVKDSNRLQIDFSYDLVFD